MTALAALAAELGVELAWFDHDGRRHDVSDDTLLAICRALGFPVDRPDDATAVRAQLWRGRVAAIVEPVVVVWDDARPVLTLYFATDEIDTAFAVDLVTEDGVTATFDRASCAVGSERAAISRSGAAAGAVALDVVLPRSCAAGVHTVTVTTTSGTGRATILAAPRRPLAAAATRRWGLFAPVYALHDATSPVGDLGALGRFAAWAGLRGADIVATLPILAMFLGHESEPCDPSPYAPVSRRFWNEAYLDASEFGIEIPAPIDPAFVDLPALAAHRRAQLEPIARSATTDPHFQAWVHTHSDVSEYARFRAKKEGGGEAAVLYHEFAQWSCDRQLKELTRALHARGQTLYLDFPIGSHREGFDVECNEHLFVRDVSVGAPPDAFHASGQNWGFPPVHPFGVRQDGYEYLRECLDAHLRFARLLRIDHVMGLHRLWYVPEGADASEGAYVKYAADEQWAAVCIAAARHHAQIIGENLGTVPEAANTALHEHGALGMWVAQFETPETPPVPAPRSDHLACTSTHDLPPFATWWQDLDARRRVALLETLHAAGTLAPDDDAEPERVLGALYAWLGVASTPIVLAGLDDLWLETEPQNRPGTPSRENFRRRNPYGLEAIDDRTSVHALLARLDTARRSVPA